jgi:exodeoxyribonuclease V alpha subunit
MIRGIGPVYARRLVQAFSEAVFDLIEQQPERLHEVTGIGAKRASGSSPARPSSAWSERSCAFCTPIGLGPSPAVRIYKTYGADAAAASGL